LNLKDVKTSCLFPAVVDVTDCEAEEARLKPSPRSLSNCALVLHRTLIGMPATWVDRSSNRGDVAQSMYKDLQHFILINAE
jgi:hypothetical protein